MPHCSESLKHGRATRCAVCDSKFGLIRYYSWRTPLCSKRCVDRLHIRRDNDRNWVGLIRTTLKQMPENHARAS
jgi:hypothetical protein